MTPHNACHQLDTYLAGDLSANDAAGFESHLATCADCRETVEQQQWIDSLLQSPARVELEHTPPVLVESIRSSVPQREQRKLRVVYSLAAAAVLLIGVGWFVLRERGVEPEEPATLSIATVSIEQASPAAPAIATKQPQATFVANADAIAVPVESLSDEVTIVQVYPTTEAERRQRLNTVLSTSL